MIDGIRLCITGDNTRWYERVQSQGYTSNLNEKTWEISATKTLEYRRNLKVEVRNSNVIIIKGSVHKAFNNGSNYNDFSFTDFAAAIQTMSKELQLDITKAKVDSFEFGVNLTNLPCPSDVAISRIVNYKGRPKQTISSIGNEYVNQRYNLKIYSKKQQYGLLQDTLRIEIKVKKMAHVNNIGITTLGDLLNISKTKRLVQFLLQAVKNLLIAEQVENVNKLPLTEQVQLSNGQNPQFWVNERKERQANYHNELKRFKKLQRKLAKHDTQAELLRLVESKWLQLFEKPP